MEYLNKMVRNFLRNTCACALCFLLQGCATWFNSEKSAKPELSPSSTIIGEESSSAVKQTTDQPKMEKTTQPGIQHLRALPRRPEIVEEPEIEPVEQEEVSSMYTVCKGDTLSGIALRFHVSEKQLLAENHLKNKNKLYVGQILVIPGKANLDSATTPAAVTEEGSVYLVRRGDTLLGIAKRFNTTFAQLKAANHLKRDTIYVGQKLTVNGEVLSVKTEEVTPIDSEKYVVQAGDVLGSIARRCHMSVNDLMQINHIQDPKKLQIGQVLYVKAQPKVEEPVEAIQAPASTEEDKELAEFLTTEGTDSVTPKKATSNEDTLITTEEEDSFEDLFDEGKNATVVPLDNIK